MSNGNGSPRPLTRTDILSSVDLPTEIVHVPRWGGDVVVKAVPAGHPKYVYFYSGGAKADYSPDEQKVRKLVGACIMAAHKFEGEDDDGKPIAGDRLFSWKDAAELREKHYNSVVLVGTRGLTLAGNTETEEDQLTLHSLLRVASYAEQRDWPEDLQNQIADMMLYLMREDVEALTDTDPELAEMKALEAEDARAREDVVEAVTTESDSDDDVEAEDVDGADEAPLEDGDTSSS